GLSAQDLFELGPRRRPVLLGHERRREDQSGSDGIGVPAQQRAELLDGSVEVAHLVEREPQVLSVRDQVRLKPERLANRSRARRRAAGAGTARRPAFPVAVSRSASKGPAAPWPPPPHIVTTP